MTRPPNQQSDAAPRQTDTTNTVRDRAIPQTSDHQFNDDLLANDDDCRAVTELYPTLVHVLYHRALIDYFTTYNERADAAKKTSRRWGKWAIVLAATAVTLAAAEIIAETIGSELSFVIGGIAAVCGLTGVAIGAFGVLYGSRKQEWLHNRFMGERIRQFHFQSLIALFPQIAGSLLGADDKAEEAKAEFEATRRRSLLQFQSEFDRHVDAKYASVLSPHGEADCWLLNLPHSSAPSEREKKLDPFFAAYRQLRIKHQLSYANYKLQSDHKFLSAMATRQADVLEKVSMMGIALLFLIHVIVLIIVLVTLGGVTIGAPLPSSFGTAATLISIVFSFAIVVIAVIALAARAFQQGLQPEREIERYQQYRSVLQSILDQFDDAESVNQKLRVMRQMERLAFDEMRNFLLTHHRSSFAM